MHKDLILDRSLRDWVFVPLTLAIVLMNMLRQYAHTVRLGLENLLNAFYFNFVRLSYSTLWNCSS